MKLLFFLFSIIQIVNTKLIEIEKILIDYENKTITNITNQISIKRNLQTNPLPTITSGTQTQQQPTQTTQTPQQQPTQMTQQQPMQNINNQQQNGGQIGGNQQGGNNQMGGNQQGGNNQMGGNQQNGGNNQMGGNQQNGGNNQMGGNQQKGGNNQMGGNQQNNGNNQGGNQQKGGGNNQIGGSQQNNGNNQGGHKITNQDLKQYQPPTQYGGVNPNKNINIQNIPNLNGQNVNGAQMNQNFVENLNNGLNQINNNKNNNIMGNFNNMKDTSQEISQITKSYVGALNQGIAQANPNQWYQVNSQNIDLNKKFIQGNSEARSQIKDIRRDISVLSDSFVAYNVKNKQINGFNRINTDNFGVNTFKSDQLSYQIQQSISSNTPYMDLSSCLDALKQYYNISANESIIVQTIDWSTNLTSTNETNVSLQSDISYNFYNPETGDKLDISKVCEENTVQLKIPTNVSRLNLTLINGFQPLKINVYDRTSDFYSTRCYSYVNESSGSDVTVSQRISKIFPGVSFSCSDGCTFTGFDENFYQICNCSSVNSTQTKVDTNVLTSGIANSNLDVFICYTQAFNAELIKSNPGFYVNGVVLLGCAVIVLAFYGLTLNNIYYKFNEVFHSDATMIGIKDKMLKNPIAEEDKEVKEKEEVEDKNKVKGEEDDKQIEEENKSSKEKNNTLQINNSENNKNGAAEMNLNNNNNNQLNLNQAELNGNNAELKDNAKDADMKPNKVGYPKSDKEGIALVVGNETNKGEGENSKDLNDVFIFNKNNGLKEQPSDLNGSDGVKQSHTPIKLISKEKTIVKEENATIDFNTNKELLMKKQSDRSSNELIRAVNPDDGKDCKKSNTNIELESKDANIPLSKDDLLINNLINNNNIDINKDIKSDAGEKNESKDEKEKEKEKKQMNAFLTKFIKKKDDLHDFTINDYNRMTVKQALKYDTRTHKEYYWDRLRFSHSFIYAFFVESNQVPRIMRIISLMFFISFQFALNAVFFSDSYIDQKNDLGLQMNNFKYTLQYQLSKSIWSTILSSIPIIILNPLLNVPDRIYKEYNSGLLDYNPESANKSLNIFYYKMLWRYAIYTTLALLLHLLSWYYVTVFCSVYIQSSFNWLYGGIISLVIKFVITQPILPAIRVLLRKIALTYQKR